MKKKRLGTPAYVYALHTRIKCTAFTHSLSLHQSRMHTIWRVLIFMNFDSGCDTGCCRQIYYDLWFKCVLVYGTKSAMHTHTHTRDFGTFLHRWLIRSELRASVSISSFFCSGRSLCWPIWQTHFLSPVTTCDFILFFDLGRLLFDVGVYVRCTRFMSWQ